MNDKTEQTMADTLRRAAMICAGHLIDAADTIDNLRAQLAYQKSLKKGN